MSLRIVGIVAAYNEQRVLERFFEHHLQHGLYLYLIDNGSTDRTRAIAERFRDRGLIGIESFPRNGVYRWHPILKRKEELAATLDADWFMHLDADEFRLPPPGYPNLAEAITDVDAQGFNLIDFFEFTFIPTREAPDHDHANFLETMRWYYPFEGPFQPRKNTWKRQKARIDLASSGGHAAQFPGSRVYPVRFPMKHYPYLGRQHAIEKYVRRKYALTERLRLWHGWRGRLNPDKIDFPPRESLHETRSDADLDASNPWPHHYLARFR